MEKKEPNNISKKDPDKINKNKKGNQDIVEMMKSILSKMITESGWVLGSFNKNTILFTTSLLKKTLPKKGNHQRLDGDIFTFEISLKMLCLTTKVLPGDKATRDIILTALSELNSLNKQGSGDGTIIHSWKKASFNEKDFIGKEKDKIKALLKNEEWNKIKDEVKKVEQELLKHFKVKTSSLNKDSVKIRNYIRIIDFVRENNDKGIYPKVTDIVDYLGKLDKNGPRERSIQRYISELKTDFHIYIDQKGKRGGYEIKMNEMNESGEFNKIYASFKILENAGYFNDIFEKTKESLQYISFDGKQFTGYRYIAIILDAIVQSKVIIITHKKFEEEEIERRIKPYLLKEYNNRWYLVGYDYTATDIRYFGLDRVTKVRITNETFNNAEASGIKDRFQNVIGIIDNNPPEDVLLKVEPIQVGYLRTYPWHESAKIEKNEKGDWIVSMYVSVNYELQQLILMNHEFVQVLKPRHLAESIKGILTEALKQYS